jgi:hypothetical protein
MAVGAKKLLFVGSRRGKLETLLCSLCRAAASSLLLPLQMQFDVPQLRWGAEHG